MDLANLRTLFFKWLPGFLTILVLVGLAVLFMRKILPQWQNYQTLATNVNLQQDDINTQTAAQSDNDNQAILQHLIVNTQAQLNTLGDTFLTRSEAEQVLKRLYDYAYSRGVRITSLQAQQPAQPANATDAAPFTTSQFQLQVTSGVANLIDFISHFREASLPGVNIVNMAVSQASEQAQLTMSLEIYTSPYASGQALNQLPTLPPTVESVSATTTATPPPTPSPTLMPTMTIAPTATPTLVPSATPTMTATLVPTSTLTFTPTATATLPATGAPTETVIACAGAQPIRFKVGDITIVHFSDLGALRVLSDPNGSVMSTRTQAYTKQRLEIIAGPVCANSSYYWYIRNLSHDSDLSWVAEGRGDERWLCPEADPVCSV